MSIILGSAVTGAKFTPLNHYDTGDPMMDRICRGDDIAIAERDLVREAQKLSRLGCRYYHYHARNFLSREQVTDNQTYARVGTLIGGSCPDLFLSFGASRNGSEIKQSISKLGEWERVSQAAIPLHRGGAHFVTTQAAIELQIICDLERQIGRYINREYAQSLAFLKDINGYVPSSKVEKMALKTNSTSQGGDYGCSSPAVQMLTYSRAIQARNAQALLHEVEWVQFDRSLAMTRMAIEHPNLKLGGNNHLNITVLFGFSPRLPFPKSYEEFKHVIDAAKSLERDLTNGGKRRAVTISAGAAVLPQHAAQHVRKLDVGPYRGEKACALRQLAAWVAQPNSGVDILRSGMEDTPYEVDSEFTIQPTSNIRLCRIAKQECVRNGAEVETDYSTIATRLGSATPILPHLSDALSRRRRTSIRETGSYRAEARAITTRRFPQVA